MRVVSMLILLASAVLAGPDTPYFGDAPKHVVAKKTEAGILISSADPNAPFSLELSGKTIEPLSSDRLKLRIDATEVEVVVAWRNFMLRSDTPDADVLRRYRDGVLGKAVAKSVEFKFGSGEPALLWSRELSGGKSRVVAATTIGDRIVALLSEDVPAERVEAVRTYLRKSLLTLARKEVRVDPGAGQGPRGVGMTLGGVIRMQDALVGKPHGALINLKLTPPKDRRAGFVVPLDAVTLVELGRFLLATEAKVLSCSVFDGAVAHSIVIHSFHEDTGEVHYWDPWGKGSFLQEGNNKAGVKARQNRENPRIWEVTTEEMDRVLCWIVLERDLLMSVWRTCSALHGSPESAVRTYRSLGALDAKVGNTNPARLSRIARYLLERKQPGPALTLYASSWSLEPPKSPEGENVIAALRAAGVEDPTAELRRLIRLPDPAVQERPRRTFDDVKDTDFFKFFSLEAVETRDRAGGGSIASYRSKGQFRNEALVTLTYAADGAITHYKLDIARSFVSSDRVAMFARDFAKSFIGFAVADRKSAGTLIEEIWMPKRCNVVVPGARRPTALLKLPSVGAMTYLGLHPAYEQALPTSKLSLKNVGSGEKSSLQIEVRPR